MLRHLVGLQVQLLLLGAYMLLHGIQLLLLVLLLLQKLSLRCVYTTVWIQVKKLLLEMLRYLLHLHLRLLRELLLRRRVVHILLLLMRPQVRYLRMLGMRLEMLLLHSVNGGHVSLLLLQLLMHCRLLLRVVGKKLLVLMRHGLLQKIRRRH